MPEVRLVRCPKCDEVLPEPAGFPVYQCGGCGTVLRAKKQSSVSDGLSVGAGDEKFVNSSSSDFGKEPIVEEGVVGMDSRSPLRARVGNLDVQKSPLRDGDLNEFYGAKSPMRERFLDDLGKTPMVSREVSQSPTSEKGDSFDVDHDRSKSPARSSYASKSPMRGQGSKSPMRGQGSKSPMRGQGSKSPMSVRTRDASKSPMRERGSLGDLGGEASRSPLRQGVGSDFEKNKEKESVKMMAPKASFGAWLPEDNFPAVQKSPLRDRAVDRPDQIKKGVRSASSDDPGRTLEGSLDDPFYGMGHSMGGTSQDGRLRSAYVRGNDAPNYNYADPRHSLENPRGPASVQESQLQRAELLRKYKALKDQLSGLDEAEPSSPGFPSDRDGFSTDESSKIRRGPMEQFLPERNVPRHSQFSHNLPMYDDQFAGQMPRERRSNHLPKHRVPGHVPGQSFDGYQTFHDSYVNNNTHTHHPACDCSLCYYSNDWEGHRSSTHRRRASMTAKSSSSHNMDCERHGPRGYDPRMSQTGPRGRSSHSNQRMREMAYLNKRLCRPISGCAPFVICDSCYQLLILPANFIAKHKKSTQLKCGACSTVISFHLLHKSFEPLSPQKKPEFVEVPNVSSPKHHRGSPAATSTNIGSYDFDAAGYNPYSMGSEASRLPKGPSRFSDTASYQSSQPNSSEIPAMTRPPPGSPLNQHLDYSSQFHISQSTTSDKQVVDKETSTEEPLNITAATETEIAYIDLPKTGFPHDSVDLPIESPVHVNGKDVQKGSGSGSNTDKVKQVFVNGQTISPRSVTKAEKSAGPIQFGEYWYDKKAGFWGVMGYRCLGIISPFIREFSYPMPEDCSRGDSAVYVNGRELPEKDLDLLANRGLPTTKNKRYVVDISGRVLDEQSREFVCNLGKLAPSVERNKCGFGMQVPENLDD